MVSVRSSALAIVTYTLAFNVALGQTVPTCPDMTAASNAVKTKYQATFSQISDEGNQLDDDYQKPSAVGAAVGVDFKVDMREQHWIFDLPSVTIKQQDVSFSTPSVTMRDQHIIFDTPSVRAVNTKCGQYPEFHGLTVVWKDIICTTPQTFMQRQDVVLSIPEFFLQQQHIIMGVPQVTMIRQDWFVKIPEFTLINVHADISKMKDKAEAIKTEGDDESAGMKRELTGILQSGFKCYIDNIQNAKAALGPQMDLAIAQLNSAVTQVRATGGNPEAVGSPPVNLVQQVATLVAQKNEQIANLDGQIGNLLAQEKQAIDKLNMPGS